MLYTYSFSEPGSMSVGVDSSLTCFLALATFFEFNHSIPNVNGKAAQSIVREKIIVRLMAKFQIERRLVKAAEEDAILGKLVAPAEITTAGEMPGASLGRLSNIVLMVIVCPTAIETALNKSSLINLKIV